MKKLCVCLLFLLAACAGSPGPDSAKPTAVDQTQLLAQLQQLPGVSVDNQEEVRFRYADQVLFGQGAVLPFPGGPALLDPLAEFLKSTPQLTWNVLVRAQTEQGAGYDQTLAEKRGELIATYLQSKGVALQSLYVQPAAGDGAPLEFQLRNGLPR